MPHDANGNTVMVGQRVFFTGKVTNVFTTEDFCNCSVELDIPMPPDGTKTVISAINTRQIHISPQQEGENAPSD